MDTGSRHLPSPPVRLSRFLSPLPVSRSLCHPATEIGAGRAEAVRGKELVLQEQGHLEVINIKCE